MKKTKHLLYLRILFFEKYMYQRHKFVKAYAIKNDINEVIKQLKKKIKKVLELLLTSKMKIKTWFFINEVMSSRGNSIVKRGKNGTNLTNLSIIRYLLWPSLPHFLVLIHWSLAFMNK